MAEGDVSVSFTGDTSGLDAAIAKVKSEMASLTPGAPGSGIVTPLPRGLGGPSQTPLLDAATAAAKRAGQASDQYQQSLEKVKVATREVGEESQRTGINVGMMFERMILRAGFAVAIFGTIRMAIKAVTDAIKETTEFETASVRFENLTSSIATADSELAQFSQTAKAIGVDEKEIAKVDLGFQKLGVSERDAASLAQTASAYAAIAGENAEKLVTVLSHLALGKGSVPELQDVVGLFGEAGNALRNQVTELQREEAIMPRIVEWQRRELELADRQTEARLRSNQRMAEFGDKLGLVNQIMETGGQQTSFQVAGVDVSAQAKVVRDQLVAGEQQIAQAQRLSVWQVRQLEKAGMITGQDLLTANQQKIEDQRREAMQRREDAFYKQKTDMEQKSLQLNQQVFQAFAQQVGLARELGNQQDTVAASVNRIGAAIRDMVDHSDVILTNIKGWVGAIEQATKDMGPLVQAFKEVETFVSRYSRPAQEPGGPSPVGQAINQADIWLQRNIEAPVGQTIGQLFSGISPLFKAAPLAGSTSGEIKSKDAEVGQNTKDCAKALQDLNTALTALFSGH